MLYVRKFLKQFDWPVIIPAVLLCGFGLMAIWSASAFQGDFLNFQKQAIFIAFGIFLMLVFSRIDWRIFRDGPYFTIILYLICLVSLVGLLFLRSSSPGIRAWYRIGPVFFDPIEFTKLVLVILLAKYFSTRHVELYRIRHILVSGIYVFLPSLLILLQPEVGSVIVIVLIWIGALLVSGIKIRHFLILCLIGLIVLAFSWAFLLQQYHKERVISFLFPSFSPLGIGWNQAQAKIAVGSGGFWGKGLGHGSQIRYGFLPASQTDFVFAGIAEERGLLGVGLVLLCFAVIVWQAIKTSLLSQSNFPRLFSVGLAILFVSQVIINIGMNLGLLPVVGIPLPLVSYGGSSLVAAFIGLGILQSIKRNP